jgi:DNA polymerase III delta subunit
MGEIHLFTGDDEATQLVEARKVVTRLVGDPPDEFAMEVFRCSPELDPVVVLGDVLGAVMTPPFLGGSKTVWLQGFPAFAEEAAASAKDPSPLAKGIARLAEAIAAGLPAEVHLVINGPGVDGRKALAAACKKIVTQGGKAAGSTMTCNRPDLKDRDWQQQVADLLRRAAADRQMTLDRPTIEYLLEVLGVDTGRIPQELDKLLCYAGEQPTLAQAQEICLGLRDASPFALSNAFGQRNLNAVFTAIAQTFENTKSGREDGAALVLTRQMAGVFRRMLHVKLLLYHFKLKAHQSEELARAIKQMSEAERARFPGNLAFSMGDWQLKNVAKDAAGYDGPELLAILSWIAEADRLNVSSALPRRLALETLALRILTGYRFQQPTAEAG